MDWVDWLAQEIYRNNMAYALGWSKEEKEAYWAGDGDYSTPYVNATNNRMEKTE